MIGKIYFPRLFLPMGKVLGGLLDFIISFVILLILMFWFDVEFRVQLLFLPFFLLLNILLALGISLWMGTLNVRFRDVRYIIPFAMRLGLYVSPVGFSSSIVPERLRIWYNLNPLVGIIDGFRWCILGPEFEPYWPGLWVSVLLAMFVAISGAYYLNSMEDTFADVI